VDSNTLRETMTIKRKLGVILAGLVSFVLAGVFAPVTQLAAGAAADASAQAVAPETASRTVEDGGTGPFKALMATDSTLAISPKSRRLGSSGN